jgi:DNA end-binding protein Ku
LPIEEGELKRVAGENARTIAIDEFVDKKNIDFIHVEKTYYLVPDKKGEKGYVILREALNATNKIGIAKVIISTKEYLAAVATYEDALVLYLLHYNNEIKKLSAFDVPTSDFQKYKVSKSEIEIAKKLINSMAKKWKPDKYEDEYKKAVEKWVVEKIHHLPESQMRSRLTTAKQTKGNIIDFVDLLKKSLAGKKTAKKKTKARKAILKHIPSKKLHRKVLTKH